MKVLVTNPPWPGEGYGARSDVRWPHKRTDKYLEYPIYLGYIVAVLEEAGVEVGFIDGVMEEMSIADFSRAVSSTRPDLVVIECSTPSIDYDLETARAVKDSVDGTSVALIGSHATFFHEEILSDNPAVDAICRGEAEMTVKELALSLSSGDDLRQVKGLSYREGEEVRVNPVRPLIQDLDSLPFPARHIVRHDGYRAAIYSGDCPTAMVSSRGCPHHCIYCLWPETLYGHKFRARSAANVVDEMEHVVRDYGVDEIYFDDDCLTLNKNRVLEMCRLLLKRGVDVKWIVQSRVDTVDREVLTAMKEAGCHYILFGVESGSPKMLEIMKKRISLDRGRQAFKDCRELGIRTQAFFLFGVPGETQETVEETIEFAKEIDADSTQFAIVIPHPGTELYETCMEQGWLVYDRWEDFAAENSLIETDHLTREEVEEARIRAYRRYYFRPSFVAKSALGVRSFRDMKRLFRGGRSVLDRISFFERHAG
ncbi:MAG: B12-binding domain-containing radical SAM protein [Chloroflexi bacterium B3_Chlor]|nr:MAG: B12-binding domain-containing radical SAM protein [Chloroflexi bacterium B3_Chlor]